MGIILTFLFIAYTIFVLATFNILRSEWQKARKKGKRAQEWAYKALVSAEAGVVLLVAFELVFGYLIPWLEKLGASILLGIEAYISAHFGTFLVLGGIVCGIVYWKTHKTEKPIQGGDPKPEMSDYYTVEQTVKPAAAEIAAAFGLEPIYQETSITVDEEERILPWGMTWRLKYKLKKRKAGAEINRELMIRTLQAEVKTILNGDNPSGFQNINFNRGGSLEPVIQIDDVSNGDLYVFVHAVIASETYFRQRRIWGNRRPPEGASADDTEF